MKDNQKDFALDLMSGLMLTDDEIKERYNVRFADRFINKVRDRTGLDIREGKTLDRETYYFLVSTIDPQAPGLDDMSVPIEHDMLTEFNEIVDFQRGYYVTWVCPTPLTTEQTDKDSVGHLYCGQFHKTDLGDEPLTRPKSVECIKCGRRYQIKPE